MLDEDGAHFSGLSLEETDWMRGHIYAAIAVSDAPAGALKRAREDLRTSTSPHVLAGTARVVRVSGVNAGWRRNLEEARRRIALSDQYPDFRFDPEPTDCSPARTCLQELDATLETMPCLLYTSPSPRDRQKSRMPSSA